MPRAACRDPLYWANRARLLEGAPSCHWCRERPATCADHLVAVAEGGTSELENLVPSCQWCNARRGAALGNARLRAVQGERFELAVAREVAWRLAHPDLPPDVRPRGRGRPVVGVASRSN